VIARLHRGSPGAGRLVPGVALVVVLYLCLAAVAPGGASAAFTRRFVRSVTETPGGPLLLGEESGVATDASGDLWVGDGGSVAEFDSSGGFLASRSIDASRGIAIDRATGDVYVPHAAHPGEPLRIEVFDDTGSLLQQFGSFINPRVAVDDSGEPSAGDVYVSTETFRGFERVDASGAPVDFAGTKLPYVEANRIIGAPVAGAENFSQGAADEQPGSLAVDAHGNIYTLVPRFGLHPAGGNTAVVEYGSSGVFLGAFFGEATPGLGGSNENGGWGGLPDGIAVDPASGHVLVSVTRWGSAQEPGVEHAVPVQGAIDEFEPSGRFLDQITETSAGHRLRGAFGVTVDPGGDLYVLDAGVDAASKESEHAVDAYGPDLFVPMIRLAEPTGRTPAAVVLNGSVDPGGRALSACEFEYVTEAAFDADLAEGHDGFSDLQSGGREPCVPAAGEIPADENTHPVHADVSGLEPGSAYRYRLAASSSGVLGAREVSAALAFTTPAAPRVDTTSVSGVSSEYAELHAQIDPLGADTSYHFEYDTRAYAAGEGPHGVSVPVPDASIGSGGASGSAEAGVAQQIGPLEPGATYHFRVVATGEIKEKGETTFGPETIAGPDATFTTLPAPVLGLPDNRAYELVTPLEKGDADDMFATAASSEPAPRTYINQDTGFASRSGDGFLINTEAAFGSFPASDQNAYLLSRTPAGWTYTSLSSPSLGVQSLQIGAFDPVDFSQVALNDKAGSPASLAGSRLTSLLGPPGGPYATLHADAPARGEESEETERTAVVGGSEDLGRVVLESKNHALAPGAEEQVEGSGALYEYAPGGPLRLLNVNSKGSLLARCGAVLGQGQITGTAHGAVSADGSRAIFTAPDPYATNAQGSGGCWNGQTRNAPQLYMRSGASTFELSAPAAGAPEEASHLAEYAGASEDASRVFFLSEAELTQDDAGIHDPELYEWRADGTTAAAAACVKPEGCLTRVSAGESGVADANVQTVPAVAAAGGAVYFTASGRLTAGAPATLAGELDLYRYATATGATSFVATVTSSDYPQNSAVQWGLGERALSSVADWYTTPDSRYLLFATTSELTGYSTAQAAPGDCPGIDGHTSNGHCDEVYRYDSQTGELACISCNPTGAPPVSNALFERSGAEDQPSAPPTRPLSDDGAYAFFDTADALVPQDTNGTLDVYEWHEGRVSLISSGTDAYPSFFLGASADGANVFIGTHANLIPSLNTESQGNIYDARICTAAEPCIKPPSGATAQCEGGSCQTPPPAPIDTTPASLAFSGTSGNLLAAPPAAAKKAAKKTTPRCKRGYVEKQVRKKTVCVKPKQKPRAGNSNRGRGR
jgi:hypothetical protein